MTVAKLVEECYKNEELANHCCSRALIRQDFRSAIDCNEAAYRAAISRYLLTSGKAKDKSLSDLDGIAEEYILFNNKINSGGTA